MGFLFLEHSCSPPEDFDWLVDYLDYIYSDDYEAAYNILLLLASIRVDCSLAKQHLFMKSLIACMRSIIGLTIYVMPLFALLTITESKSARSMIRGYGTLF